jgi:hypothetical protein
MCILPAYAGIFFFLKEFLMKHFKPLLLTLLMSTAAVIPLTAGGSSEARLYVESPSPFINTVFNGGGSTFNGRSYSDNGSGIAGSYDGAPNVYPYNTYLKYTYTVGPSDDYHDETINVLDSFARVTIRYAGDTVPYVIKNTAFFSNPNYYYGPMSGRDTDSFLGFETGSSGHDFPERYLHRYAYPTATKDASVVQNGTVSGGKIRITYTLADGKTAVTKDIPVVFQRRDCEAYSNGRWQANAWEGAKPVGWIVK